MKLLNKHILLTGATGGIGQAIAKQLAKCGANIHLISRSEAELQSLTQLLQTIAPSQLFSYLVADLTVDAGINAINEFAKAQSDKGQPIDILINNAGSLQFQFFAQRSSASVEQEVRLNLVAPMLISHTAIQWLNKPGIILNIGSTFSAIGYPGYVSYCAAKAGLHRFTEALDRELNGSGIRVLFLAPRATQTSLNTDIVNEFNEAVGNKSDLPEKIAFDVQMSLYKLTANRWIGWPERLFVKINQLFPAIVSKSIYKNQQKIHEYINKNNRDMID